MSKALRVMMGITMLTGGVLGQAIAVHAAVGTTQTKQVR